MLHAIIYLLPHCHFTPSPDTTSFLSSLSLNCFCLVYLGIFLPFLWEFVKREARVGDLIESEGMGGVVGWRGTSPWGGIFAHRDQKPERDLDEEGDGMCLGLAHPSVAPHSHM